MSTASSQKLVLSAGVLSKIESPDFGDPKFAKGEFAVGMPVKKFLAAQPSAVQGDTYIATATAGNWTKDDIEFYNGAAWVSTAPVLGQIVWVENLGQNYKWDGTAWVASTPMKLDSTTFQLTAGVSSTMTNRSKEGLNTGGYDKHFSVY